ncbi:unnamed protein product [Brachionus calyciflorus]|uniref:General transcription factor IIH subunit 3 n=1 Tax=Brachionus calyciflorus TaxID=104777 RepID=A0A813S542_9BILA|nr:unnamed protein product [Brachionus calyciflorus]
MTRYITTFEIIKDYFTYRLNTADDEKDCQSITKNCKPESKYVSQETLISIRKLAIKAENDHRESFDCYLNKILFDTKILLDENCETKIMNQVKDITNMLFDDNCINWGRLIILLSFTTYLTFRYSCKVNSINKASSFVRKLMEYLTSFITCKYGIWIECNGGWKLLDMSLERNLLIVVLDTNPIWWGLQNSGLIPNAQTNPKIPLQDNITFNDCLSAVIGFLNAYKTMNQNNSVVLIAAHNTKAEYLYPSKPKIVEKNSSPWDKYEQISDMYEIIRDNLKKLSNEQLSTLNSVNNKDNLSNDSMITSAMGLGLCYINRIQKTYAFADSVKYRFVIVKASDDSSNQYMSFMNMIFSAEKSHVVIDSCALLQESSLLQQASNLTNGVYFKIPQINGLLSYLLWLYLPDESTRKMLVYPPKTDVDYRAACFCHHKLIDVGYVCSVCLSVFCSFTPICTTCNCNFRFDVNMLKKASSLKQGLMVNKLQYNQKSHSDPTNGNSNIERMDTNSQDTIDMID